MLKKTLLVIAAFLPLLAASAWSAQITINGSQLSYSKSASANTATAIILPASIATLADTTAGLICAVNVNSITVTAGSDAANKQLTAMILLAIADDLPVRLVLRSNALNSAGIPCELNNFILSR